MSDSIQQPQPPSSLSQNDFLRRVIRKVFVLSVIAIAGLVVLSMTASRPNHIGANAGSLAPVPDSPNCVSSVTDKDSHKMSPIDVSGIEDPLEKLKSAIESEFSRAALITEKENYLHYEFTSMIFRFTDDVEFLLDVDNERIDFRSASRVGYSDMGTNRKRMEQIRSAFEK